VELVEQEDNPDRDLCRFEFYEIIVRLARPKYKNSGMASSLDAAVKMIIEENLVKNTEVMGGPSFREKYIFDLGIDDLFRANETGITSLYNLYTINLKKNLDMKGCFDLVKDLGLPEHEVKLSYSFAKMPIVDEMTYKDRYDIMLLPELYEFICRCAYFKFKSIPDMPFLDKVEKVLDILLK
jgi:hypothetical protein